MLWQTFILWLVSALASAKPIGTYYPYAQATEYKGTYESHENPHPFDFGYEVQDEYGNKQQRQEHGDEHGNVKGSYGYTDAAGVYRQVDYVADGAGFRAVVKSNEPGLSNEDPADVHVTANNPPSHVLEQSIASSGGGKASTVGSYSEPKVYLKSRPAVQSSPYSESYKPTYKETYAPSAYIPVAVQPYSGAASYVPTRKNYYGYHH